MSALTVTAAAAVAPSVRAVLATLPRSFTLVAGSVADVHAISGGNGWPQRAEDAARRRPAAVLVVRPSFATPAHLRHLAAACAELGVTVALAEPWASGAAVARFCEARAVARVDEGVLIEGVAGFDAPPRQILLAQIRLMRAAFACTLKVDSATTTDGSYLLAGEAVGEGVREPLLLVGSVRHSPMARLRRLALHGEDGLCVFDGDDARPTMAWLADVTGERALPLVHESAHRAGWRRLRVMLDSGEDGATDLELFAQDLAAVSGIPW